LAAAPLKTRNGSPPQQFRCTQVLHQGPALYFYYCFAEKLLKLEVTAVLGHLADGWLQFLPGAVLINSPTTKRNATKSPTTYFYFQPSQEISNISFILFHPTTFSPEKYQHTSNKVRRHC
jgi:hypothetical protein